MIPENAGGSVPRGTDLAHENAAPLTEHEAHLGRLPGRTYLGRSRA